MSRNLLNVVYAFFVTATVAFSVTNAQNTNANVDFLGDVSVKIYCTFNQILPAGKECDTNILINDSTPTASTDSGTITNSNGQTVFTETKANQVGRVINSSVNNPARVVYVQGPAGRDGKNGTTTIVYQTSIAGASNPGISAYINAGGNGNSFNSNYNPFQTTVPGDIYSTFIHFLKWETANGDLANITNINATNTNTVNLTATNFTLGTGTISTTTIQNANVQNLWANNATTVNSTTTNLYAQFASLTAATSTDLYSLIATFVNLFATNATISNATTTNLFSTNASITNATATNIFANFASITAATTSDLFSNRASITEATTTYFFATFATLMNLFVDTLTFNNATGTNLQVANASTTNLVATGTFALATGTIGAVVGNLATFTEATTTNLFSTNASLTNATGTNLFVAWFKALNASIDNLLFLNATGSNLQLANATVTNLTATGTFALATGTIASTTATWANVNNLWAGKATVTNSTSTNIFAANASITNATTTNLFTVLLNALTATFTNLLATNATITNATSTNLSTRILSNDGVNPLEINSTQPIIFRIAGSEIFRVQGSGFELLASDGGGADLYVADDIVGKDVIASTSVITNSTTTNLFSTNASLTNATTTNLFAAWANFISLFVNTLTFNSATGTNLQVANASTTNLVATGTFVLATGTIASSTSWFANVLNLWADNLLSNKATFTEATTTNLYTNNFVATGTNISLGTTTMFGSLIPNASTTYHTLGSALLPWAELYVSSSSVYIGGNKISNVDGTLVWSGPNIQASGTNTSITAANLVASTTNTENLLTAMATLTSATSTNLFVTWFKAVNAMVDNLMATNATITNATTTNLFATWFTATNSKLDNLIFGNATGTNLAVTNLTATGTFAIATGTIASTTATWANVNNLWTNRATFTEATSSTFFAENLRVSKVKINGSTQLGVRSTVFDSLIVDAGLVPDTVLHIDAYSGMSFKTQGNNTQIFMPAPTDVNEIGKIYLINNVGTNTLKLAGAQMAAGIENVPAKQSRQLVWTDAGWMIASGETNITNNSGTTTAYIALRATTTASTTGTTNIAYSPLSFPIAAGEKWIVQITVPFSTSNNNVDMGLSITNSGAVSSCNYGMISQSGSDSTNSCGTILSTGLDNANNTSIITGVFTATGAGNIGLAFARTGSAGSGTVTINSGATLVAYKVTGADLAEVYFAKDATIEEGDVVALDGTGVSQVGKASKNYQKNVLGIISTKPGLVMGEADGTGKAVIVGLSGRVPVKVTAKNGNIKAGDFLTASDIPGVAMKATGAGQVIGQALTDYTNTDVNAVGKVMVFIKNTYHDGNSDDDTSDTIADKFTALVKNTIEKLSGVMLSVNLWVSEIKANTVTANRSVVQEFCVGSECFNEADMKEFRNYLNSKKVVEAKTEVPATETSVTEPVVEAPVEESSAAETETTEVTEATTNTEVTEAPEEVVTEAPVETATEVTAQ